MVPQDGEERVAQQGIILFQQRVTLVLAVQAACKWHADESKITCALGCPAC